MRYQVWCCNNYEPLRDDYMVYETDNLEEAGQTCVGFNTEQEEYAQEQSEVYNYENYSPEEWYEIREIEQEEVTKP